MDSLNLDNKLIFLLLSIMFTTSNIKNSVFVCASNTIFLQVFSSALADSFEIDSLCIILNRIPLE